MVRLPPSQAALLALQALTVLQVCKALRAAAAVLRVRRALQVPPDQAAVLPALQV